MRTRWIAAAILLGWVALISLGFASRLKFGLEDDELQHLQMAWRIGQGDVPYRDFFELHPPAWHFAIAPFVRQDRLFSQTPFVPLRIAHTIVIVLLVLVGFAIVKRDMPLAPSAWTAGLFLISSAFSYAWFDFRPDWIALLLLLCAVGLITQISTARALVGGICIGLAATLTQKAWFGGATCGIWMIATAIFAPSLAARKKRLICVGAITAGIVLPIAALIGYFAAHSAAKDLINDTFLLHIGATRERFFGGYIRAAGVSSAGLMALGVFGLASIARRWRNELATAGARGLIALLAATGAVAYIATPAPFEQAYLFLVGFWFAMLAGEFLWQAMQHPRQRSASLLVMMALAVLFFAAIQKTTHDRAIVGASWLAALLICAIVWRFDRVRPIVVPIVASLIGLHFVIHENVQTLRFSDRREKQSQFYEALDARLAADEPIITFWPPALPFRRHVGRFPFVHQTILEVFGKEVESEYLSAIAEHRVNLVTSYQPWFVRFVPKFDAAVKAEFRPLDEVPQLNDWCDTFVRKEKRRPADE